MIYDFEKPKRVLKDNKVEIGMLAPEAYENLVTQFRSDLEDAVYLAPMTREIIEDWFSSLKIEDYINFRNSEWYGEDRNGSKKPLEVNQQEMIAGRGSIPSYLIHFTESGHRFMELQSDDALKFRDYFRKKYRTEE